MFDSRVYELRNQIEFARPGLVQFMKTMALNEPSEQTKEQASHGAFEFFGGVRLECGSRPDVSSRYWWTIEWIGVDGETYRVMAQDLDLALWRAIQKHRDTERRMRAAEGEAVKKKPVTVMLPDELVESAVFNHHLNLSEVIEAALQAKVKEKAEEYESEVAAESGGGAGDPVRAVRELRAEGHEDGGTVPELPGPVCGVGGGPGAPAGDGGAVVGKDQRSEDGGQRPDGAD